MTPSRVVYTLVASVILVVIATCAKAHDIYMRPDLFACCHDADCRPAEPGEIVEQDNGSFLVVPSGEVFTRAQVKASPDGRYHRCLFNKAIPTGRSRCVLVPAGV